MLAFALIIRVCTYATSTKVRNATGLSNESLATFNLRTRHQFEVVLALVAFATGLFRASLIGTPVDLNEDLKVGVYYDEVYAVGAIGLISVVAVVIMEGLSLVQTSKAFSGENARFKFSNEKSKRRFDHKDITEDTIHGGAL
ncbi:hypothetical protein TrLO_g4905 [Triparma laevis f. longispina]|nr:hypothetical protein TrLO_g4905 [Triparma laevis f. longispina]